MLPKPEFKIPNKSRIKPFVHTLAGAAYSHTKFTESMVSESENKTSFSFSLAGGLDYDASKRFATRPFQAYYNTAFPKNALGEKRREDNLELSFRVIFKF